MLDKKGVRRGRCLNSECDCDEYMKESSYDLCAYCSHPPVSHDTSDMFAAKNNNESEDRDESDAFGVKNDGSAATTTPEQDNVNVNSPQQHLVQLPLETSEQTVVKVDDSAVGTPMPQHNVSVTPSQDSSVSSPLPSEQLAVRAGDLTIRTPQQQHSLNNVDVILSTPRSSEHSVAQSLTRSDNKISLFPNGLKPVLESCTDGQLVLMAPELTSNLRSKLAAVIINHILQQKEPQRARPRNEDIAEAAQHLIDLFPAEKLDTWYTPPKMGIKKIAGGKLTEKLRNTWRLLSKFETSTTESTATVGTQDEEDDESIMDDLNWLKYNMQPWTMVLQKWKTTASHRTLKLQKGLSSLKDFKLYADPRADSLLNIDFQVICAKNGYPECGNKLFELWPGIGDKLRQLKQSGKQLYSADDDDDIRAFKVLVHRTCSKRTVRLAQGAKRKSWCPSLSECQASFIIFAKTSEEAEAALETLRSSYESMKLTVQPVVLGMSQATVVVYNHTRFPAETLVKGVDLCFKLIHMLHLEYNAASLPAWMFIQRYIYGITTEWDVPSPKASELATSLKL